MPRPSSSERIGAKSPERIFWDWDGVLGLRRFWYKTGLDDAKLLSLKNFLFVDKERTREWMRGKKSAEQLAQECSTDFTRAELGRLLVQDWKEDAINEVFFKQVSNRYPAAKHYIVTDNMDVFNDFAQSNVFVRNNFLRVFNSSDYGVMKDDEPSLYEAVLRELSMQSFAGCLALDDSATNCQRFEELGGNAILVQRQTKPLG